MTQSATTRNTEELQVAYLYWLSQTSQLSDRTVLKFKEHFPTFESWDALSPAERKDAARSALGDDSSKVLTTNFDLVIETALRDMKFHESRGIKVLAIHGLLYPQLLKRIPDPPLVLFVKGAVETLGESTNVAIVGTRQTTPTGEKVAARIAKWLGEHHWCIVSGLAKGIDAAAHRGALEANAKTIAVMATALDKVYPAENRELADQILEGGGCWVSELALRKQPHRGTFVQRDRIQSGLSVAVIPVQTDVEGGTMHTVRFAEQQERLLLCPRPIAQESSLKQYAGIRRLIETHRASSFASDQYGEVLDALSNSLHRLLNGGFSQGSNAAVTKIGRATDLDIQNSDRTANAEEKHKSSGGDREPDGRLQEDFAFVADLNHGKSLKYRKRSRKSAENEIGILEQLVFEVEHVKNPDGTGLSNVDAFKNWLESKIRALKSG
jgi:DNA processing protein